MPKPNKSSASSGTRKKHARRAAPPPSEPADVNRKDKKNKNAAPRPKAYIPPSKPAPAQADPLDVVPGLQQRLEPKLLVVLRSLGKKAAVTKIRALEELQTTWLGDGDAMLAILPVWAHHLPVLVVHADRRIRALAVGMHAALLRRDSFRAMFVGEYGDEEMVLGTWCLAAHDVDRGVAATAGKSLPSTPTASQTTTLTSFCTRTVLDPLAVYALISPPTRDPKVGGTATATPGAAPPTRGEDEEEGDRKSRLRVSALGSLRWLIDTMQGPHDALSSLFSSSHFWTILYPGPVCPYHDSPNQEEEDEVLGHAQPGIRKAAWSLINTLVKKSYPIPLLTKTAVLRSAWLESEYSLINSPSSELWSGLLNFLHAYPDSWMSEQGREGGEGKAYAEFLAFLGTGCAGYPVQGYPAVLIIINTIPNEILLSPSPTALFAALFGARDTNALSFGGGNRAAAGNAWVRCVCECAAYVVRRLVRDSRIEQARDSGTEMAARVWRALIGDEEVRVRMDVEVGAEAVKAMIKTIGVADPECGRAVRERLEDEMVRCAVGFPREVCVAVKVMQRGDADGEEGVWDGVVNRLVETALDDDDDEGGGERRMKVLLCLMDTFAGDVWRDVVLSERIDRLVSTIFSRSDALSNSGPQLAFLLSYLRNIPHTRPELQVIRVQLWRDVIKSVSNAQHLEVLVGIAADVPVYLRGSIVEDHPVGGVVAALIKAGDFRVVKGVFKYSDLFVTKRTLQDVVRDITRLFEVWVDDALRKSATMEERLDKDGEFDGLCECLGVISTLASSSSPSDPSSPSPKSNSNTLLQIHQHAHHNTSVHLFLTAYLLPTFLPPRPAFLTAKSIWSTLDPAVHAGAREGIVERLRGLMSDVRCAVGPEDILGALAGAGVGAGVGIEGRDVLVRREEVEGLLGKIPPAWDGWNGLGVIWPLIPPASLSGSSSSSSPSFPSPSSPSSSSSSSAEAQKDTQEAFAAYVRAVRSFIYDRHIVLDNPWMLRYILALEVVVQDALDVPSAFPGTGTGVGVKVGEVGAGRTLLEKLKRTSTFLLLAMDERAPKMVIDRLLRGDVRSITTTTTETTETTAMTFRDGAGILDIVHASLDGDSVRDARVLQGVLGRVLEGVGREDADKWIKYARSIEKRAPRTAMAICSAITSCYPQAPLLDRYRNELAASLLGIPPKKANTLGLETLWKLACVAPAEHSDVVFLTQLRAVNVVKAVQGWINADDADHDDGEDGDGEGVGEEVESALTLVFTSLVPILQNVPGLHWELIFDVVENNLESCLITEDDSLVTLSRTLKLVRTIRDLVVANKSFREMWMEREGKVVRLIMDRVVAIKFGSDARGQSKPRSVCREQALAIVHSLPSSMIGQDALSAMCHLLEDSSSSVPVQCMTYQLLQTAAHKRTESVVVEAAVDTEGQFKVEIPLELLALVQRMLNLDDLVSEPVMEPDSMDQQREDFQSKADDVFGYLLGWMVVFDLFAGASFKVKSDYIDQLRALDVIPDHFIPTVFAILRIDQPSLSRAVKLDVWAVEEYHVELYEHGTTFGIPLLAAHLYYRALTTIPSLIHSWLMDCKDRQLSTIVLNYTSQYFSPILIATELAQLKNEDSSSSSTTTAPAEETSLVDDTFNIKVYTSVREVSALYLVDEEHQLEIKLKIPSGLPLQKIEVKDVRRVGVDDLRWRAWILAVQQIIWSRNGSIVDALRLFKKNVTSHFSGQVECAICYSTISMMDGQLPRKPCKTCKNRFHSGCLFKWFNSSHSSSCPLCRSDIL